MPSIYVNVSSLWQHHQDGIAALREHEFKTPEGERRAALVWFATSGGKTRFGLCIPFEIGAKRTLIVAPGNITARRFNEEWEKCRAGKVIVGKVLPAKLPVLSGSSKVADSNFAKNSPIVICTIQWLLNRIKDIGNAKMKDFLAQFDLVICDEGHHVGAPAWQKLVHAVPAARVVYLTGTPKRSDGEPLPLVPFTEATDQKGIRTITMCDLADVTGLAGARFTLSDALANQMIKTPKPLFVEFNEVLGELSEQAELTADSVDSLVTEVKKKDHRLPLFAQDLVIRLLMEKAREAFEGIKRQHAPLKTKLTAIVKVRGKFLAERTALIANALGWHAVAYYGEEGVEDVSSETMKRRLSDFENKDSSVDCIIQDSMLTEGYNNSSICLAVLMCNMQKDVELEQFLGRGLRLIDAGADGKRLAYNKQPELLIVALNWTPIREKVEAYIRMATDLSTKVHPTIGPTGGGGADFDLKPLAHLISAGAYFVSAEWEAYAKSRDTVRQYVDSLMSTASEEIKAEVERQIRDGALLMPNQEEVPREREAPLGAEEAREQYKLRVKEIASHVHRNAGDLKNRLGSEYDSFVYQAVYSAISAHFPKLDGGFKNANLDIEQLYLFLKSDLYAIKSEALTRLRSRGVA